MLTVYLIVSTTFDYNDLILAYHADEVNWFYVMLAHEENSTDARVAYLSVYIGRLNESIGNDRTVLIQNTLSWLLGGQWDTGTVELNMDPTVSVNEPVTPSATIQNFGGELLKISRYAVQLLLKHPWRMSITKR